MRGSVREDLNIELAHVLRVGNGVDGDDLPIGDRKPQYDTQPSLQHNGQSDRAIHHSELRRSSPTLEGLRNSRSAAQLSISTHLHGYSIGREDDVGIKNRQ